MNHHANNLSVLAPLSGEIIALEQVSDPVFSGKVLGDGIAIIPEDGKIYSPVNGTVTTVSSTLHAYGFSTESGLDILVHVGLETVSLKGEGFKVYIKEGDMVKAGELIAEVDLEYLKQKNISATTPVLICTGAENKLMETASGTAVAGKTSVITLSEKAVEKVPETAAQETKKEKKKLGINFDFLQKLGKVLMTVIAVMPAAGLMLSVGKLVQMAGADVSILMTIGSTMENIGWAIITNLHILFAAAIGGSWAKERAGGAFAAIISFILINRITGAVLM